MVSRCGSLDETSCLCVLIFHFSRSLVMLWKGFFFDLVCWASLFYSKGMEVFIFDVDGLEPHCYIR